MPWFSRLFGIRPKTNTVAPAPKTQNEDDANAFAWRNRYLAARIKYLNGQLRKRKIGGISAYELPEDLGAGSILHLATLNENLAARVGYLEDVLNAR